MNPLAKATALAMASASLVSANNGRQLEQSYSIRALPPKGVRISILDENYVPPWRDDITQAPTMQPTEFPTERPTTGMPTNPPTFEPTQQPTTGTPTVPPPPTNAPTTAPPTQQPTKAPVEVLVGTGSVTTKLDNYYETSCTLLPQIGNFVTETLDIEYNLYLSDEASTLQDMNLQDIIDGSIEPQLHEALVDAGLGCENADFLKSHAMVDLSTSGRDLIGTECAIEDLSLSNATECYTVWGQIKATMWFSPRRRQLQDATLPFGDREAFTDFTKWIEEAMDSLEGYEILDTDAEVVKAEFRGFANVNEFDEATEVDLQKDLGVDIAAAFTESQLVADDGGINVVWGSLAVGAGALVLISAMVIVVLRRKRNRKAFMEHVRVVDDLALDSKDEIDDADIVDDEELFQETGSLPAEFKVKLESEDHDYRWIGEQRTQSPIFVATERNKEFHDHLATLKRKKEQEVRARQYQVAML